MEYHYSLPLTDEQRALAASLAPDTLAALESAERPIKQLERSVSTTNKSSCAPGWYQTKRRG